MGFDRWIEVTSSSIKSIRFKNECLDVSFIESGKYCRYYKIATQLFNEMMNSSSVSLYIKNKIKSKYQTMEFDIPKFENQIEEVKTEKLSYVEFSKVLDKLVNEGFPDSELLFLYNENDSKIKMALSYVIKLPKTILMLLVKDPDLEVRKKIAHRVDLDKQALDFLKNDPSPEIIELIANKAS
jgi:hypothetical protein